MFFENRLSDPFISAPFVEWLRGEKLPRVDFSRGGLGINNASQGLDIQTWRGDLSYNGQVVLSSELADYKDAFQFFNFGPGANNLSIAFDNNMQPCAAVQFLNHCAFRWYDGAGGGYVTLIVPGARDMLARIDDPRNFALLTRDTILSYIRNDVLCFRKSSERFQVERPLYAVDKWQRLYQCGMNTLYRFQWEFVWDDALMRPC